MVKSKVVQGVRHAEITFATDGQVQIVARRWGFCVEPALGLGVNEGLRPVGDIQFLYMGDWGTLAGVYYKGQLRPYLAGSYSLSRLKLRNSDIWLGVDLKKEIIFGVRVRI